MTVLVTGGAASGKSACAEHIAEMLHIKYGGPLYYLAAMEHKSAAARKRIAAHRRQRAGKGFVTVERERSIGETVFPLGTAGAVVLLECLTVLAANELFLPDGTCRSVHDTVRSMLSALRRLERRCACLIAVCSDIFAGGTAYSDAVRAYLDTLAEVRNRFAAGCSAVIETTAGIPIVIKGTITL